MQQVALRFWRKFTDYPYCTNDQGRGPAWAKLFEDNAEFAHWGCA